MYFSVFLGLLMAASASASSVTYTYDEGGRLKLVIYDEQTPKLVVREFKGKTNYSRVSE